MKDGLFQYSSCALDPVNHPPIPIKDCPCCGCGAVAFSWIEPLEGYNDELYAAGVTCHECGLKLDSNDMICDITDREATVIHTIECWNKRVQS